MRKRYGMKKAVCGVALAAASAMVTGTAWADADGKSVGERLAAIEEEVRATKDKMAGFLGIELHGFAAASYNYNFNRPSDGQTTPAGVFHPNSNSIQFDQFNLALSRSEGESGIGFGVSMDFGKVAERLGGANSYGVAGNDGSFDLNSVESGNYFELREAFVTYKAPIGPGITIKAGKFATLLGYEIIDNWDNHNHNISRSYSFNYANPFTHTGVLASMPIGEMFSVDFGVVNGWDNSVDNNFAKSILGGIGFTPSEIFSLYTAGIWGAEDGVFIQDGAIGRNGNKRAAISSIFTLAPVDFFTLAGEFVFGTEEGKVGPTGMGSAQWAVGNIYFLFNITEKLGLNLRGELFHDADDYRLATGGEGATVLAFTPTLTYQLSEGLLLRTEYRFDTANRDIFTGKGRTYGDQHWMLTQAIYSF